MIGDNCHNCSNIISSNPHHWKGDSVCKPCYHHLYLKEWSTRNPEYHYNQNKKYLELHPDYFRKYKRDTRYRLMTVLCNGEPKCFLCSEDNPIMLHIDHINGDGWYDRTVRFIDKRGNHSRVKLNLYYIKHIEEAREKLQVLCYQHHFTKSIENGDCNGYRNRIIDNNQTKLFLDH